MNAATILLAAAVLLGVLAAAAVLGGRRIGGPLLRLHAAAAAAATGWLLVLFLVPDTRVAYVWDHTHAGYPLVYRVAGLWAGQEGTLLLWGALVAALAWRIARPEGATRGAAGGLLVLLSTALLGVALAADPFAATDPARLARLPDGRGLADVLVTPLMVIHPPVQFAAYALLAVPAAFAAAGWLRRDEAWLAPAYAWARPAWLATTLGLGLGALWAYYVLSFGGYWAWDPVETSNLVPWLALTAFLHAGKAHERGRPQPLAAPLLAFLAGALALVATFATRSGLWVSVHAFTDPTGSFQPDAGARLLAILDVDASARHLLALCTAVLLGGLALFARRQAEATGGRALSVALRAHAALLLALAGAAAFDPAFVHGLLWAVGARVPGGAAVGYGTVLALLVALPPVLVYLLDARPSRPLRLEPRALLAVAAALLGLAAAVAFLLNLQVVNAQDRARFDLRAPFVAVPLVSVLTVALALPAWGKRRAVLLALGSLAAALASAAAFPEARVVALAVPLAAAAAVAAVVQLAHVQGRAAPAALRLAGVLLMLAALGALVMWSNPPSRILGETLPPAVPTGIVGFSLGAVALLGSVACLRMRDARLATAGAVAGVLAAGYGLGALLALVALVIVRRERSRFLPGGGFARREAARLRETGIYLVHFALVVGLLGYAASTYAQDRVVATAVAPGERVEVGDHALLVGQAQGARGADGRLDALVVPVRLLRDDGHVADAELRWSWRPHPSATYEAVLHVERSLGRDVYLQPLAVHTSADGWVGANVAAERLSSDDVDAVTFAIVVLPLMTLVWACLWTMGLGMILVLVGARLAPKSVPVPVRGEAVPVAPRP